MKIRILNTYQWNQVTDVQTNNTLQNEEIRRITNQNIQAISQFDIVTSTITLYFYPDQNMQMDMEHLFRELLKKIALSHPDKIAYFLASFENIRYKSINCINRTLEISLKFIAGREIYFIEQGGALYTEVLEDAVLFIRKRMIFRKNKIILIYPTTLELPENQYELINRVETYHMEGSFNDYTYLKKNVSAVNYRTFTYFGYRVVLYNLDYRTTYEEELRLYEAVDQKIQELGLNLPGVSRYEKIGIVYRFITRHCKYDTNYQKYTAYHAMIDHCAVCQGYACLFYLFMRKLDVPVEYISGTCNDGGRHAWNLVKHGKYWYNIDTTWEKVQKTQRLTVFNRKYFLKSNNDFGNHYRDRYFNTPEFIEAHQMGKYSV